MNENELISIVKEALSQDCEDVSHQMNVTMDSKMGDEGWDSLGHLNILTALDKKLDGKLARVSEVANVDSIRSLIAVLKKNALM